MSVWHCLALPEQKKTSTLPEEKRALAIGIDRLDAAWPAKFDFDRFAVGAADYHRREKKEYSSFMH